MIFSLFFTDFPYFPCIIETVKENNKTFLGGFYI